MKKIIIAFFVFFLISSAHAIDLDVEKTEINPTVIAELNEPATFTFEIRNNGPADYFEIYTLLGVSMTPKGTFYLNSGERQLIEVGVYPSKNIRETYKGPFAFEYQIKGTDEGIFKDKLRIKIVELEDVFEIHEVKLTDREQASIIIENKEDISLENVEISLSSNFFETTQVLSFMPYEEKTINIELSDNIQGLVAGQYVLEAEIKYKEIKSTTESLIDYLENGGISVDRESSGFIIKTTTVTKSNEGNIPLEAEIIEKSNVLSRLFITYSEKPTSSVRSGPVIEYTWESELKPGESLSIEYTTNYTIPFILLILIIAITLGVKIYTQTNLVIRKRVSFVRTKGGELALKVTLRVRAKKHLDNVEIIDRLPMMTKIYEKFGIRPDKIEEKTRRMFWNLKTLNAGEERVFTYIIYSKINIVGKFELPSALAIYEMNGKTFRANSNKTYFVSETSS